MLYHFYGGITIQGWLFALYYFTRVKGLMISIRTAIEKDMDVWTWKYYHSRKGKLPLVDGWGQSLSLPIGAGRRIWWIRSRGQWCRAGNGVLPVVLILISTHNYGLLQNHTKAIVSLLMHMCCTVGETIHVGTHTHTTIQKGKYCIPKTGLQTMYSVSSCIVDCGWGLVSTGWNLWQYA